MQVISYEICQISYYDYLVMIESIDKTFTSFIELQLLGEMF